MTELPFLTDIFAAVLSFDLAGLDNEAGQYEFEIGDTDHVRHVVKMNR